MPGTLTPDSITRKWGGGDPAAISTTPVAVSIGADQTIAGNTYLVLAKGGVGAAAQTFNTPAGWLSIISAASGLCGFLRGPSQGLAAGESSWNFTPSQATALPMRWTVLEIEGVAVGTTTAEIIDASSGTPANITSGTTGVDTTTLTSTYDGLALSLFGSYNSSGVDTWGSYTDQFQEVDQGSQAGTGTDAVTLAVTARAVQEVGTYGATATCSRALAAAPNYGAAFTTVLYAANARTAPQLVYINGNEHGTITGNTLGPATLWATVTGSVTIATTAKRSGNYGMLLSSTTAACNAVSAIIPAPAGITRNHFRFPTLPAADLEFWAEDRWRLRFIVATGKLGMTQAGGTEIVSDQAITANQWFGVDVRRNAASPYTMDWSVDYNAELTDTTSGVAQTQATGTGGTSIAHRIGWTTASTATMHCDDTASSNTNAHYPIGDIRILPLKVDPSGTPSISGTSTNFGVMTNNGTVAAWNATNARNAIDDVPPDLSGTRDAAICLLAHATDYAEFPMETIDLAAQKLNVRGVKGVACLWAAAATAATIRLRLWDGATERAMYGEADPNADNAATPVWTNMLPVGSSTRMLWTQAMIDDLRFRMGSNDATPDIGVDSVVFEIAVIQTRAEVLFGESGGLYVEASRDPDTQGLVGFTMNIPTGQSATVDYEVDGTPFSTGLKTDADSPFYQAIPNGGESIEKVNKVTMTPG